MAGQMKALTVQQPWAWAIIHGGKDVENRTQAWKYRGPLAIHAGARISARGLESDLVDDSWWRAYGWGPASDGLFQTGVILGTVDLVGAHTAEQGCCDSPWGEKSYDEHGGRTRRDVVHLELENPKSLGYLPDPIEAKGRLGLWTPTDEVLERIEAATR